MAILGNFISWWWVGTRPAPFASSCTSWLDSIPPNLPVEITHSFCPGTSSSTRDPHLFSHKIGAVHSCEMSDKPLLPNVETQKTTIIWTSTTMKSCCTVNCTRLLCIFVHSTQTAAVLFTATVHAWNGLFVLQFSQHLWRLQGISLWKLQTPLVSSVQQEGSLLQRSHGRRMVATTFRPRESDACTWCRRTTCFSYWTWRRWTWAPTVVPLRIRLEWSLQMHP